MKVSEDMYYLLRKWEQKFKAKICSHSRAVLVLKVEGESESVHAQDIALVLL